MAPYRRANPSPSRGRARQTRHRRRFDWPGRRGRSRRWQGPAATSECDEAASPDLWRRTTQRARTMRAVARPLPGHRGGSSPRSAGQSLFEDRAQAGRSSHAIGRGRPRLRAPSQIRHPGVVDRRTPSSGRARGHGLGDLPGSRVVRHVAPARARGPRPSIRSGRSMGSHRHARSARCSFWSRRLHRRGPAARCPGRGGCHDRRARTRSESLGAGSRLGLASSKYTTRRSTITYLAAITGRWSPTASHRTASPGTGSTGFGTMAS